MTSRKNDQSKRPDPIAPTLVLNDREPITFLGIGVRRSTTGEEPTTPTRPSAREAHEHFMSRLPIPRANLAGFPRLPPPPPPGRATPGPMPAIAQWVTPEPAAATPMPPVTKNIATRLFREQALRAYEGEERLSTALQATSPSLWAAVLCTLTMMVAAGTVCAICHIDQVGDGPGILRPPGGARTIAARASGRVSEVLAKPGTLVEKGDVVARVSSAELAAQQLEADGKVTLARRALERFHSEEAALFDEHLKQWQREQDLTRLQMQSQAQSQNSASALADALRDLSDRGIAAKTSEDEAFERLRQIDRAHLSLQQQLAQANLNLTTLKQDRARKQEELDMMLANAVAARKALAVLEENLEVVAPEAGRVESISVRPGELVQTGTPLATLVPPAPPSEVIAFIADRDRAFVAPGTRARVELNQLPSAEYGLLEGHVKSIASAFATAEEMRAVQPDLRVDGPAYRVEIALDDMNPRTRSLVGRLQAETLVTVHVVTRSRRIIALLFEPVAHYLEAM